MARRDCLAAMVRPRALMLAGDRLRHRLAVAGLLCTLSILGTEASWAGPNDGQVLGHVALVDRGPSASRFDIVIMSDGYRDSEMQKFHDDAAQFAAAIMSGMGFDADCRIGVNIHRIDVTSIDSGANPGDGSVHRTYFDAYFLAGNILASYPSMVYVADERIPEWDVVMLIVNEARFAGMASEPWAFVTSASGPQAGVHELGHALGLADEYDVSGPTCGPGIPYTGAEPTWPNVTIARDRASVKWGHLIAPTTPVPTSTNPECRMCVGGTSVPPGTVGLFEGAANYACGVFRPEFTCRMRDVNDPFCAVCREHIARVVAPFRRSCDDVVVEAGCGATCADGNDVDGDGCDSTCRLTGCGSGARTGDEECDDGNAVEGDGCDSTCRVSGCGSGARSGDEQCDDGNETSGDGCSPDCRIECGSVDPCVAADPCVVRTCTDGLCAFAPPSGKSGASCRLRQIEQRLPCDLGAGLRPSLRDAIRRRIARALQALERAARSTKPQAVAKRLRQAESALVAIDAKAQKSLARHKTSRACREEILAVLQEPRAFIAALLGS
jgi:cysteine-rich repeat protein